MPKTKVSSGNVGKLEVSSAASRKKAQIISELAKATGVDQEAVTKILEYLSIDGSLAHREYKTEQVSKFAIPVPARRLSNVSLQSVRIATSEVAL